jgi:FAD/FMN-containing dehydrogenase
MTDFSQLAGAVTGSVLLPGDDGYADACTGFNLAFSPRPDAVVRAADAADVVAAVRFARDHGIPVHVQATGHGAHEDWMGGLLIDVADLGGVSIDPDARTATFGGGVRWGAVVAAAAEHRLAPVTGSSTSVGAVGFLLGGGFGPFARVWGAGSDRLRSLRVVTGAGELVTASEDEHPDLFWALRGGKGGLGVVVEATVELIAQDGFVGGAAFFDIADAEGVLDGWLTWSADLDERVTTSFAIMRFPGLEVVPPPLRGRHLVSVRFAAPVDAAEGERLAAPVRALGPVVLDGIAALPIGEVARITNDPTDPSPAWGRGFMLRGADPDFVRALLGVVGAGTDAPFVGVEVRQLGGAAARDVEGGSPVGGRENPDVVQVIGVPDPSLFATVLPSAFAGLRTAIEPWIASTTTINWLAEEDDAAQFRSAWDPETFARLAEVRHRYDPDGILPYGPAA